MKNVKRAIAGTVCAAIMAAATPALAQQVSTLASYNPPGGGGSTASRFLGQSFLVTGSGDYDNITFTYFDASGNPVAAGQLYIFGSPCNCVPNNVAMSGGATGVVSGTSFVFAPTFTLTAGNTYYAYADTRMTAALFSNSSYADGDGYTSAGTSGGSAYSLQPGSDTLFSVQGIAVGAAPEPASWALMVGGFGLAGGALRRRRGGAARRIVTA